MEQLVSEDLIPICLINSNTIPQFILQRIRQHVQQTTYVKINNVIYFNIKHIFEVYFAAKYN